MKLGVISLFIVFFTFGYTFAQNITPDQIGRAQEILQKEEALRQEVEQPQKVFIKEIILPQGCLIPKEEIEEIAGNFTGHWHSLNEIQEILDILANAYQKAHHESRPFQAAYVIEEGKLRVNFKEQ